MTISRHFDLANARFNGPKEQGKYPLADRQDSGKEILKTVALSKETAAAQVTPYRYSIPRVRVAIQVAANPREKSITCSSESYALSIFEPNVSVRRSREWQARGKNQEFVIYTDCGDE